MEINANISQPLYEQIAEELKRRIRSGEYPVDSKLPTEIEFADQVSVSRGTVRQAMDLLVREKMLIRRAGKGTFVCQQNNTGKLNNTIGVVMPYLRDTLISEILRGIESVFQKQDFHIILTHSDDNIEEESIQIKRLLQYDTAGLIIFPIADSQEYTLISPIIPENIPLVLVDRHIPGFKVDTIVSANEKGASSAVEHLLENGHKRIACITTVDRPSSVQDRIKGYEAALRKNGSFPLAAVSLAGWGVPTQTNPRYTDDEMKPVLTLMGSDDPPTALFCVNDYVALGVMDVFRSKGIRIPDDVSIVGFDDIILSSQPTINLTTIAQDKRKIGEKAAEAILEQVAKGRQLNREIIIPTKLIARGTVKRI